jgi:hypothetical protein
MFEEGRVGDVLKDPSAIDVLVEVTSALLARISSQNHCGKFVAWTEFGQSGITERAQERRTRYAERSNTHD